MGHVYYFGTEKLLSSFEESEGLRRVKFPSSFEQKQFAFDWNLHSEKQINEQVPRFTQLFGGYKTFYMQECKYQEYKQQKEISQKLWGFGSNNNCQLGSGDLGSVITSPIQVNMMMSFGQLICTANYSMGVSSMDGFIIEFKIDRGQLYGWGDCRYGCISHEKSVVKPKEIQKSKFVGNWGAESNIWKINGRKVHEERAEQDIKSGVLKIAVNAIAGCENRSYAIINDSLYGMGKTELMGCEDTITTQFKKEAYYPILIGSVQRVSQIAVCQRHNMLLTQEGQVYTWGYGDKAQLGHPIEKDQIKFNSFQTEPKLVESMRNKLCIRIQCNEGYSLTLTSRGELYSWGFGFKKGESFQDALLPQKLNLTNEQGKILNGRAVKISSGSYESGCIDEIGRLYFWIPQRHPKLVGIGMMECKQLLCGHNCSLAILDEKTKQWETKEIKTSKESLQESLKLQTCEIKDYILNKLRLRDQDEIHFEELKTNSKKKNEIDVSKATISSKHSTSPHKFKFLTKSPKEIAQNIINETYRTNKIQSFFHSPQNNNTQSMKELIFKTATRFSKQKIDQIDQDYDIATDRVFELERVNSLHVPLKRYQSIPKQQTEERKRENSKWQDVQQGDQRILKYEYIVQMQRGRENQHVLELLKEDEKRLPKPIFKKRQDFQLIRMENQHRTNVRQLQTIQQEGVRNINEMRNLMGSKPSYERLREESQEIREKIISLLRK